MHKDVSSTAHIITITGLPGTGKSWLIKNILLKKMRKPIIVIDPNLEYEPQPDLYVFRLKNYKRGGEEVAKLSEWVLRNKKKVKTLVVDESNVVFNKISLDDASYQLINTLRHNDIDLVAVARRPVDINISISELSRERYVFRTEGVNDVKRLNDIVDGLGDEAKALKGHEYIYVSDDSHDYIHKIGNSVTDNK